jgi:hypothetical protein
MLHNASPSNPLVADRFMFRKAVDGAPVVAISSFYLLSATASCVRWQH